MTTIDVLKTPNHLQNDLAVNRDEMQYDRMNATATIGSASSKNSNRKRHHTGSLNPRGGVNPNPNGPGLSKDNRIEVVN